MSSPSSLAQDHLDRLQQLIAGRTDIEAAWRAVARVAAPEVADFSAAHSGMSTLSWLQQANAAKNSKDIYDTTAIWCVDRLASGIEALVMPQAEHYHSYTVKDYDVERLSDSTKLWIERLRNFAFRSRYDADANFVPAIQTAIRRSVAFGNGFVWADDATDGRSFARYRYLPLAEGYIAEDKYKIVDTYYRVYTMTNRQAVSSFGNRVSAKVQQDANDPKAIDKPVRFLHAIYPRAEFGRINDGSSADARYASVHIEMEPKQIVRVSGYYSFPIIDFRWMPEGLYGEGPVMKALADIQSLNELSKAELVTAQLSHNPTLLVANAGVMNRPRNVPGDVVMGGINAQGQVMVKALHNEGRLDFANAVIEAKRGQVKESLYINLFAVLIRNPEMSATEAMIRANEKGELLGPAGSRYQLGISRLVERELDIFQRAGVFAPGAVLEPPRELGGRRIAVQHSSPLDRYRLGRELEGMQQMVNMLAPMAQAKPEVYDIIDEDEYGQALAQRLGVPVSVIRSRDAVKALRDDRAQGDQMAVQAKSAKDFAAASKAGVEALAAGQQSGII